MENELEFEQIENNTIVDDFISSVAEMNDSDNGEAEAPLEETSEDVSESIEDTSSSGAVLQFSDEQFVDLLDALSDHNEEEEVSEEELESESDTDTESSAAEDSLSDMQKDLSVLLSIQRSQAEKNKEYASPDSSPSVLLDEWQEYIADVEGQQVFFQSVILGILDRIGESSRGSCGEPV